MKIVKTIIISILVISCRASFIPLETIVSQKSFNLEEYEIYTFRLVSNQVNCDVPRDITKLENGLHKTKSALIYEELYLLLNEQNHSALYITTLSHKYIYKGGAFNRAYNKEEILINDIDFLYEGIYDKDSIQFSTGAKKLAIAYKKEDNNILFTQARSINLDDTFGVDLVFVKDTFTKKDITKSRYFTYFDGCKQFPVTTIYHDNTNLYFKIQSDEKLSHPYRKIKSSKTKIKYYTK